MAGTAPTLDVRSVAPLSDAEIDAFVHRVARILRKRSGAFCERVEEFCAQIEELLDEAEKKKR